MSFKIVQTIEYGVQKLTVVPTLWESNGIVRWPPKTVKFASKLIKDGNSRPGPEWSSFKCVLKRNCIPTFEEANKELYQMELNTDTDYDNDNCGVPGTSHPDLATNDEIDFDAMAQNLAHMDNSQPSASDSTLTATVLQQDTIQVITTGDIHSMLANQAAMLEKLNIVVANQKKIALKLASLAVQLEETKERPVSVALLQDQLGSEENESFSITPIENQQQMEMLEANLADKAQKKKFSKTLSLLCSSTVGGGTTCAYKLLDVIFSRDFLCQCSWSGGSKGEISKIPLKNYKNFRKFFFEIVNSWDSKFTDDDAEKFLKLVVRNAAKRKAMKGLRQSTKRTRKSRNCGNDVKYGEKLQDSASKDREELQTGEEDVATVSSGV
ncbi:uncharacterized protein LOC124636601 [Helicoverpa zea]|uniref:uncharacterized protein LOC124636601 n=1 Tax=Helicoverpa zea TaxID=7113 RepID=UPI001F564EEB|nr:uncharacterized protein LOC124636601 [Helicoverpa zea]